MSNKSTTRVVQENFSRREVLKDLCEDKEDGLKDFECEIKTEIGRKVVDVRYKLAQAYEENVHKEIKRLLDKKYIRESKYTWLNNVRPVIKDDGSVRLTTNLIKLNTIVEQGSYTLPSMDEKIFRLGKSRIFFEN
ncbi:Retrovirus-related Pol polyprotein from transposon [Nosema granulosis]|uniref:Retrovirus-related Pol polyprotein from transposon n=1 Tax=Nosema granulosis TaxID=83296 RepID=A0A9P6KY40_9MICR|nr:Retrovirus-related Pol polyprotein from transposon [Nosema granulosis]